MLLFFFLLMFQGPGIAHAGSLSQLLGTLEYITAMIDVIRNTYLGYKVYFYSGVPSPLAIAAPKQARCSTERL